jgi:hypothetical protein
MRAKRDADGLMRGAAMRTRNDKVMQAGWRRVWLAAIAVALMGAAPAVSGVTVADTREASAGETARELVDRLLALPDYVPDARVVRREDSRRPLLQEIAAKGEEGAAAMVAALMAMPSSQEDPGGTKNSMRWQLIRDAGALGDVVIKPAQEALGKAKTEDQRREMVQVIGAVRSPAATKALLGLLAEKDETVLDAAISSLTGRLGLATEAGGSAEILPALAKAVPNVQTDLYRSIVCTRMQQLVKPLSEAGADAPQRAMVLDLLRGRLKNDPAANVRFSAACVLTEYGDYSGLEELEKAALALQTEVVGAAFALDQLVPALERATGQTFGRVPMSPLLSSSTTGIRQLTEERKALLEKVVAWIKANPGAGKREGDPGTRPN